MWFIKYTKNNLPKTYTHQGLSNKSRVHLNFPKILNFHSYCLFLDENSKRSNDFNIANLHISKSPQWIPTHHEGLCSSIKNIVGDPWFGRSRQNKQTTFLHSKICTKGKKITLIKWSHSRDIVDTSINYFVGIHS